MGPEKSDERQDSGYYENQDTGELKKGDPFLLLFKENALMIIETLFVNFHLKQVIHHTLVLV